MIMDVNEVVRQCQKGDQKAWNMIVDRFSKSIFNIALNFSSNRDDAADITQDIFVKIYKNIDKFKEDKSFSSWIHKIAKNYCIDYWRKNKKNLKVLKIEENLCRDDQTPENSVVREYDVINLRNKLLYLDTDLRLLIIMRDIQDLSYQEISENLDLPLGTVKSRINRARIKLARLIMKDGE